MPSNPILRRFIPWLGFGLCCGLISLLPSHAQAQRNHILLHAPKASYVQGKSVHVYVFFYQISEGFSFFQNWTQALRNNRDFRVLKREQISVVREVARDPQGFPVEVYHSLYRLTLQPQSTGTLRYGPLRYQRYTSNALSFTQAEQHRSTQAQIKTNVQLDPIKLQQGKAANLTYTFTCPAHICDFSQISEQQLRQHFQRTSQLDRASAFWSSGLSAAQWSTQNTAAGRLLTLRYQTQIVPLKAGTQTLPQLHIKMPTLQSLNLDPVKQKIAQWLNKTHNVT
ncbi:MAG: hypothetical protein AAGJ35_12995, partial [Myxococcota bacterium]